MHCGQFNRHLGALQQKIEQQKQKKYVLNNIK